MARQQAEAQINAPAQRVYEYLLDFSRHPEWAAHPLEVEAGGPGAVGVGSTFRSSARFMGHHEAKIVVTDLAPGRRIVFESEDDTGRYRHEFTLSAEGDATALTKSMDQIGASFPNKVLFLLAGPVVAKKGLQRDVRAIKAKLEAV